MKNHIYTFYNLSRQVTNHNSRINSICLFNCYKKLYSTKMKYLNVAEKNDAAKNIALHLSRGTSRRREGLSQYNKIYEFEADVMGQKSDMIMTSVSGHLLALEFVGNYKNWQNCSPLSLFDAPVFKYCPENYDKIKKTLEREIRNCQGLIIWTDCDREGENIGFEIIQVCTAVKSNINIYRAKFSEITAVSVRRALNNLEQPNKNISDAVDVRQELDLRIGAAFTRFQTLRLQRVFPTKLADSLVSYGSCQFPTLGFVVERYRAVENFIAEPFWKIKVTHKLNDLTVDFNWERVRLFDQDVCQVLHDICKESPVATVCQVKTKPKSKWRPLPLDTVELEKLASRKLKINAKETMRLAERLYTQGFISYPRTETNEFPREMNLGQLVGHHTGDPNWGAFAQGILDSGGPTPRQGNKSDKAHPPIHPTKYTNNLTGNEQRLYEFIVRSFLACCSKDAQGQETSVVVDVAGERFNASGLMITARNYLEVYPYDKWSSKEIHVYEMGQTFSPTSIDMVNGSTSPPNLLTEADLISLMEKHGIGTDATHADHIETIKSRSYVALADSIYFVPGLLGMGLVEGYDAMGLTISKPHLRAQLEADLKAISEGTKQPQVVLAEQIAAYKEVYIKVTEEANKIDLALAERFSERPVEYTANNEHRPVDVTPVLKCPKCGSDMMLRSKKNNADELYISCMSYPNCKNAVWLPSVVRSMEVTHDTCQTCGPNFKLIKFQWRNNSLSHLYPPPYTGCIGGCDMTLLELMNINLSNIKNNSSNNRTNVLNNGPNVPTNRTNLPNNITNALNNGPSLSTNRSNLPNNRPNVSTNNTQGQHRTNQARIENITQARQFVPPPAVNTVRNPAENRQGIGTNTSQNPVLNRSQSVSSNRSNNPSLNRSQSAGTSRMPLPRSGDGSEENSVVCNCNKTAILLTVKKQNENLGKKFYKCPVSKDNGGCDFFSWARDADSGIQTNTNSSSDTTTNGWGNSNGASNTGSSRGWGITPGPGNSRDFDSGNDETVMCDCRLPCKKITVYKEGPNKGRPFYGCAKEINHRCKFFQWADEAGSTSGTWGVGSEGSSRGRGRGRNNQDGPKTRKCGLCRQEGHTRAKCPNNNTDY